MQRKLENLFVSFYTFPPKSGVGSELFDLVGSGIVFPNPVPDPYPRPNQTFLIYKFVHVEKIYWKLKFTKFGYRKTQSLLKPICHLFTGMPWSNIALKIVVLKLISVFKLK